jgi:RNA polymerase sigma factor (sigma-70 family)
MGVAGGLERTELYMTNQDGRLEDLYAAHVAKATRLAFLLTGDRHVAQDVAHEAFVRVGAKLPVLREPDRAAGYLLRTVANLSKDHTKRMRRERDHVVESGAGAGEVGNPLRDEVLAALMKLPSRQRLVVFLRYYLDMSEAQAAATVGCSTSAVKSLTNRAMVSLRGILEGGRS